MPLFIAEGLLGNPGLQRGTGREGRDWERDKYGREWEGKERGKRQPRSP